MPESETGNVSAADGREIELKFALTMENALRLLDNPPWAAGEPGTVRRLRSTYFDTADHALRRAGFSLRIRDEGGERVQTVKTLERGGDAFAERGEWSCPVRTARPNLRARAAAVLRPLLDEIPPAAVVAVFTVDVTRHKFLVPFGAATIEVALDIGAIIAGQNRESFCELELELKSGPKAALFGQAAAIARAVPMRLDPQAKAERGFALLAGGRAVLRAERVVLSAEMPLTVAFQHIARNCLRQLLANENAFRQSRLPEAVHQARVAIRRLRAAMTVFRPVCDDDLFAPLKSELRWAAGEMGRARELDVYIDGIVRKGEARYGADPDYRAMLADCREFRDRAYESAATALASSRFRNLMLTLAQWIECGAWLGNPPSAFPDLLGLAARQLNRRWKPVRRLIKHHANLDDTARHTWRIEVKKLRYAVDFFLPLFVPATTPRRKETAPYQALKYLTDLQDGLGMLNDIAEAQKHSPLSAVAAKLVASRAESWPELMLGVDMAGAALTVLMPFWKKRAAG